MKSNNVVGSLDNIGNKVASRITNIKKREYMQKSCIRRLGIGIFPVITEVISTVLYFGYLGSAELSQSSERSENVKKNS